MTENVHPKDPNLLQINTEIITHLEFPPNMNTRASTANGPIDHNVHEIHSVQSMITEKMSAQRSQRFTVVGFQSQTQTNSVISNPKINNT